MHRCAETPISAIRRRLHRLAEIERSTEAYLLASIALALLTHRAGTFLSFPGSWEVSSAIPLAFFVQSVLTAILSTRIDRARRERLYLVDLAAWSGPLLLLLAVARGSTDYALWFTLSIFGKLAVGLVVLGLAIRHGLSDSHIAWALAFLAFTCYSLTIPYARLDGPATHAASLAGDEPHYLMMTLSLVRDHDLFLEDEYSRPILYYAWYPADLWPGHTVQGRDGHLVSFHDFGFPIVLTIPYALGGWQLVLVAMPLMAALTLREVYLLLRVTGCDRTIALLAGAAVGFSLPFVVYAIYVFAEIPLALASAVALRQIWTADRGAQGGNAVVAGLATATLPWLHVRAWPLAFGLLLAGTLVWRDWRRRTRLGAPLVVGTIAYTALTSWMLGRPLPTPLVTFFSSGGSLPVPRDPLPGALLLDQLQPWLAPYDGLLLLAPVFVLAFAGVPLVARMGRAGLGTVIAAALYSVSLGTWTIYFAGSGWGPPARYMVPEVPLLAVPLGATLQAVARPKLLFSLPLVVWGVSCTFLTYANLISVYARDAADAATNGPAEVLARVMGIPLARLLPNFQHPGVGSYLKAAIVIAVIVGLGHLVTTTGSAGGPDRNVVPAASSSSKS